MSLPLVRPGEAIAPGRAALPPRGLVVANDHTSNVCIGPRRRACAEVVRLTNPPSLVVYLHARRFHGDFNSEIAEESTFRGLSGMNHARDVDCYW